MFSYKKALCPLYRNSWNTRGQSDPDMRDVAVFVSLSSPEYIDQGRRVRLGMAVRACSSGG